MNQVFSKIWIIVILISFIVGGVFVWQYFGVPGEEIKDETANWQTYRNEEFGFEIKYPDQWGIRETGDGSFEIYIQQTGVSDIGSIVFTRDSNIDTAIQNHLARYVVGTLIQREENISLDGKYGKLVYQNTGGRDLQEDDLSKWYFVVNNGQILKLGLYFRPKGYDYDELFDLMLSTFRFIENARVTLPTTCKDELDGVPVITSISPASGLVGTEVEIRGCNLGGFEGDLDAVFVRSDGEEIPLYGGTWYPGYGGAEPGKLIKIIVRPYCESGSVTGRYSGITSPCETVNVTPGTYKVYAEAWGKKSNEALFIIKSSENMQTIKLYYYNEEHDPNFDCITEAVISVEREIPITNTPIQDTVKLLIEGKLTVEEKAAGFSTEFPHPDFELLGANLTDDGILTLDFPEVFGFTSGGSCRVGILNAEIEKTVKQFSQVKEVKYTNIGIFQP